MPVPTVGVVHPGEMGAAVGAVLVARGCDVLWVEEGRSDATRARAKAAGLTARPDLGALASDAGIILSVCPPAAAIDVARQVAATPFEGTYVDANAVAPSTVDRIREVLPPRVELVDGGIVGPPPSLDRSPRLYLSGARGADIARLFEDSFVEAIDLGGPIGRASAVKACFAHSTKVTVALLTTLRALAREHDVDDALMAEWQRSIPHIAELAEIGPGRSARKAWRFVGEMEEIARALADAGLPSGAPEAAAEVYRRQASFKDTSDPPALDDILRTVAHPDVKADPH